MKKMVGIVALATSLVLVGCNNLTNTGQNTSVEEALVQPDNYTLYTDAELNKVLSQGKNVALFVYSKRCGSCNLLNDNLMKGADRLPENAHVLKIDYATQKDVMKKFDVDTYHVVVYLDQEGKENNRVEKSVLSIDDLLADWPIELQQTTANTSVTPDVDNQVAQSSNEPQDIATVEPQLQIQATQESTNTQQATQTNQEVVETEPTVVKVEEVEKTEETQSTENTEKVEKEMVEQTKTMPEYLAYTQANLDNALASGKDVVLFVHSRACGSCNLLDGNISKDLAQLPDSMTVLNINYSTQADVMKKFGVDSYHTLVYLDAQGKETNRVKGTTFTVNDIIAAQL